MEIPELNLFMMCREVDRRASRPLPEGFRFRLCREDELGIWGKMNVDDPQYPTYMAGYFDQVYAARREEFFRRCTFVCEGADKPVATCFLWPAYGGRIHTVHWFKVLPGQEGKGLGRALLSHLFQGLGRDSMPLYLHTHPHCLRAVGLYADFGFKLLQGPPVGGRPNDLQEAIPYLRAGMPKDIFARLQVTDTPQELLDAAASAAHSEF